MTRDELAAEPTLRTRLRAAPAAPLLAPLASPPLAAREAAGLDLILEGFLAHHAAPRDLTPAGGDRHVLAGDFCYAAGLVRVAEAGDVFVIRALAELVALASGLVAEGRRGDVAPLWRAVTACIADPDRPAAEARLGAVLDAARRPGGAAVVAASAAGLPPTPELDAALA